MGFFVLLLWVVLSWFVGMKAADRGRSSTAFFLLSLVTSPLLGIIILYMMADLEKERRLDEENRVKNAEAEKLRKEEHEKQLEAIKVIAGNKTPQQSSTEEDSAEKIAKMHKLFTDGVLTEEEFQAAKKKILGL